MGKVTKQLKKIDRRLQNEGYRHYKGNDTFKTGLCWSRLDRAVRLLFADHGKDRRRRPITCGSCREQNTEHQQTRNVEMKSYRFVAGMKHGKASLVFGHILRYTQTGNTRYPEYEAAQMIYVNSRTQHNEM